MFQYLVVWGVRLNICSQLYCLTKLGESPLLWHWSRKICRAVVANSEQLAALVNLTSDSESGIFRAAKCSSIIVTV